MSQKEKLRYKKFSIMITGTKLHVKVNIFTVNLSLIMLNDILNNDETPIMEAL